MYHVTTDNAFPYRVCGGQQDSGSACVDSRSNDGEITFHDWHPVNIQEYGDRRARPEGPGHGLRQRAHQRLAVRPAAPARRRNVGPDMAVDGRPLQPQRAHDADRSGRRSIQTCSSTSSNAVWKTHRPRPQLDAHQPRPRAPDVGRAGQRRQVRQRGHAGPRRARSPRSRRRRATSSVLWAGTDDGNDPGDDGRRRRSGPTSRRRRSSRGRASSISRPGHFDTQTAYAAANTMRLDDMNPHFWRTHDGGKTWTEIDNGLAPGAVANSIREDPREKGLLYAATDTQVWVSFDDGDHWHSLRLNMPAISVRDIQVKDDSTCLCADLVAGTHGRGFWILDDVTPLRQTAAAQGRDGRVPVQARDRGARALRHQRPDAVAARSCRRRESAARRHHRLLPGARRDRPGEARDPRRARRSVVRTLLERRSGAQARSGARSGGLQQALPAEPERRRTAACPSTGPRRRCASRPHGGMHRFSWDLHYDPIGASAAPEGEGGAGAVPHRTYPAVERAVGAAGQLHRAADGERQELHAAAHAASSIRA